MNTHDDQTLSFKDVYLSINADQKRRYKQQLWVYQQFMQLYTNDLLVSKHMSIFNPRDGMILLTYFSVVGSATKQLPIPLGLQSPHFGQPSRWDAAIISDFYDLPLVEEV